MAKWLSILIFLGGMTFAVAQLIYTINPNETTELYYFLGRSASFSIISLGLWIFAKRSMFVQGIEFLRVSASFLVSLALTDTIDELFFDPTELNKNEIISFMVLFVFFGLKWRKLFK